MPLHLLGKKSWNVYNADNVARVQRDEAAAKAAEDAEEQRMQEVDAQRRLAILRGENPPSIANEDQEPPARIENAHREARASYSGSNRRKRKREGEDDTEFELRLAREKNDYVGSAVESSRKTTSSAPIVNATGHIDLLGDERLRAHAEKNEEAEKELKKKKREYEDQYTMRLSNAAGKDGTNKPWYSQSDLKVIESAPKNVFGRDDPKRKEREAQRIAANDPLAMMKSAASKMRELKQERKKAQEEQDEQLRTMRNEERRRARHRQRREKDARDNSSCARPTRPRSRPREGEREPYHREERRGRGDREERGRPRDLRSRSPALRSYRREE